MRRVATVFALIAFSTAGSQGTQQFDVVIRGGTIYDGSGNKPIIGDVAIRGDSIVAIGASI